MSRRIPRCRRVGRASNSASTSRFFEVFWAPICSGSRPKVPEMPLCPRLARSSPGAGTPFGQLLEIRNARPSFPNPPLTPQSLQDPLHETLPSSGSQRQKAPAPLRRAALAVRARAPRAYAPRAVLVQHRARRVPRPTADPRLDRLELAAAVFAIGRVDVVSLGRALWTRFGRNRLTHGSAQLGRDNPGRDRDDSIPRDHDQAGEKTP